MVETPAPGGGTVRSKERGDEDSRPGAPAGEASPTGAAPAGKRAPARPGIVRTGLLTMAGLVALGLTRLLHGALVSRATDQETYGLVGTLIAVTTIGSLLLPAGVASAASKFIPYEHGRGDPAAARGVHRLLVRVGWAGAVPISLGAAAGAAVAFDLGWVDALQVAALCCAFSAYSVQKSVLYGFGLVPAYTRLELICSGLSLAATVLVVAAGWTVYLLPLAAGYAVFTFGAWRQVRPLTRGAKERFTATREIAVFVSLACVGTLCSQGFLQGTQLLAQHFAAPREVAYFAAAVTLIAPAYFLPRALGIVLFPSMARAHGAGDVADVRRQADVSTRALFVVLAPLFAVALLVAPEILTLFGGGEYADGAPVLRLMLAATYLAVVAVPAVNVLSSGAHVRVPVLSAVAGLLTGLGVVAALGGPLGAAGVGIGYLCGTAVTAGGPIVIAWRLHRMSWRAPVGVAAGFVALVLVAASVADRWLIPGTRAAAAAFALIAGIFLLRGQIRLLRDDSIGGRLKVAGGSPSRSGRRV
ncbi:lipopolysaccharide biosynthesis protein [Phytohabitans kaempferiae]|uniref:Lipopolysaccharide biosynthesis protein n=1 Tax=Phytohabitans kaempferiae TaxID=1620943 RepID=A0ABV6LZP0_9ACTN